MMQLDSAGRAMSPASVPSPRPAKPQAAGSVSRYRVDPARLFLANRFQEAPAGPIQQAVQNVLQALRWDPIDGRLVTFSPAETEGALSLAEAAQEWLAGRDGAGLHLLQLGACVAAGLEPEAAMRQGLAVLQAYKARGGQGVFVGGEGFYWRLSTHLALPGSIAQRRDPDPSTAWHAEGGEYRRARDGRSEGLWRRRPGPGRPDLARENRRPADSFDPLPACLFEPMGDLACRLELGGNRVKVPFRPFVARLGRLRPWPPNGPERLAEAVALGGPAPAASRLAAWFAPCDADLTMTWRLSPPLA